MNLYTHSAQADGAAGLHMPVFLGSSAELLPPSPGTKVVNQGTSLAIYQGISNTIRIYTSPGFVNSKLYKISPMQSELNFYTPGAL